jgi:Rieske Fe-S protein
MLVPSALSSSNAPLSMRKHIGRRRGMFRPQSDASPRDHLVAGVDRRAFLRSSALGAACAWTLALLGCSEDEPLVLGEPDGNPSGDDTPPMQNEPPVNEPPPEPPPPGVEVRIAAGLKKVGGTQRVVDKKALAELNTDNANGKGLEPLLLVRVDDATIAANTVFCTHQQCEPAYNERDQVLDCPCHGSRYSMDGRVVRGPAARALKHFKATIQGDSVFLEA